MWIASKTLAPGETWNLTICFPGRMLRCLTLLLLLLLLFVAWSLPSAALGAPTLPFGNCFRHFHLFARALPRCGTRHLRMTCVCSAVRSLSFQHRPKILPRLVLELLPCSALSMVRNWVRRLVSPPLLVSLDQLQFFMYCQKHKARTRIEISMYSCVKLVRSSGSNTVLFGRLFLYCTIYSDSSTEPSFWSRCYIVSRL